MKIRFHTIQAVAVALALLAGCRGDPEQEANKLFVEASPLWAQYQTLPKDDPSQYEARLKLLTQVDENLKSILRDFPESSLAVELASTGSAKGLKKADIDGFVIILLQSIPAAALMAEVKHLRDQYQALSDSDPAQYEARLKLLTQVDTNLGKILKDYPLSYEAAGATKDMSSVKFTIANLQQSFAEAALMAEVKPLWDQYQDLGKKVPSQYEGRLALLNQIEIKIKEMRDKFPKSHQVNFFGIGDIKKRKLEEIVLFSMALWNEYILLPGENINQHKARVDIIDRIEFNMTSRIKEFSESYLSLHGNFVINSRIISVEAIKNNVKTARIELNDAYGKILHAQTKALWIDYLKMERHPANYNNRLTVLLKTESNLSILFKDFPADYSNLGISIDAVRSEMIRLK